MPVITLQFPRSQYPSLQIGDTAYYVKMDTPIADFQINDNAEDFVEMGTVTAIDNSTSLSDGTLTTSVSCNISNDILPPTTSEFIFFTKDNMVNCSSLLGYYNSVVFENTSTRKAEMFAASCEISQSSK